MSGCFCADSHNADHAKPRWCVGMVGSNYFGGFCISVQNLFCEALAEAAVKIIRPIGQNTTRVFAQACITLPVL
jgi:hypothetical protein